MTTPETPVTAATTGTPESDAASERRAGVDRRKNVVDRRSGLERRRGPGRRRPESRRSAEEGELNDEQFEFVMAIDEYRRINRRPFPTWTEVLEVIKYLGYRKVAARGEHLDKPGAVETVEADGD
ncbi:MAG: hypothetical protein HUU22_00915 [Phycisphaerae bacterium]|nr:hypothetical protein [Phycisphaerae bacterium]NUQ44576.1 hypothetical protein [Phycisphaerae bacterium]